MLVDWSRRGRRSRHSRSRPGEAVTRQRAWKAQREARARQAQAAARSKQLEALVKQAQALHDRDAYEEVTIRTPIRSANVPYEIVAVEERKERRLLPAPPPVPVEFTDEELALFMAAWEKLDPEPMALKLEELPVMEQGLVLAELLEEATGIQPEQTDVLRSLATATAAFRRSLEDGLGAFAEGQEPEDDAPMLERLVAATARDQQIETAFRLKDALAVQPAVSEYLERLADAIVRA